MATELMKRFREATKLLRRCRAVMEKPSWKDGETDTDVCTAITEFLGYEQLADEIGGMLVPCVVGASGRNIPDLTKMAHKCEYQSAVKPKATADTPEGCCGLCGLPMLPEESMFVYHGYSESCEQAKQRIAK